MRVNNKGNHNHQKGAGKPIYNDNSSVLKITGISNDRLQYFIRLGLIVPAVPGFGRGKGHKYDIANLRRIALLNELDSLGLDAGTIKKIIIEAPPNTIGTVRDESVQFTGSAENNKRGIIPRALTIFRVRGEIKTRWFQTALDAYKYFYPEKKSGEGFSSSSFILIDTVRLGVGIQLRATDLAISDAVKFFEKLQKDGKLADPFTLEYMRKMHEMNLLALKGEFDKAKEIRTQATQELAQKREEKTDESLK